jgi:transposase
METRKRYPSDVSDEEWIFVVPYLTLLPLDAEQRKHDLREVFNALRWLVRSGAPWRMLPNDLPPWYTVYQQTQRWLKAGCFEAIVHDLRMMLRLAQGRPPEPSAAIFDSQTVQSTPESGSRAGYDGYKRKKGSKLHVAVDTLGHLLAMFATPASEQDRAQVAKLAQAVQEVTNEHVEVAFVDQNYTGEDPAKAAQEHGITLQVVKLPEAKRGFVLLPRRWVVEITQPQYPQAHFLSNRRVDRTAGTADDRSYRAAELAGFGGEAPGSLGLRTRGRWCAVSGLSTIAVVTVPPRP